MVDELKVKRRYIFKKSREDRFWEKVNKDGPVMKQSLGKCWIWTARINRGGYGEFKNNESNLAHRYSYQLHNGKVPEGLELDHLCRNRACVNPDHLEVVNRKTNVARGIGPLLAHFSASATCSLGHLYTYENTYVYPDGERQCRTCKRRLNKKNKAEYRRRKRENTIIQNQ